MSKNRFLGGGTVFDVVLGFIFGSMLSRAINGPAPLAPTLLAGLAIFVVHWVVREAAARNPTLSRLFIGEPHTLIRDGQLCTEGLQAAQLSENELASALRHQGVLEQARVRLASLEQSGTVSVVTGPAQVIEVEVHEGVQRIRIELG